MAITTDNEATAAMAAFVGWRAFKPGKITPTITAKKLGSFWIWDGERAAFYKRRRLNDWSGLSPAVVLDFGWVEVAVPTWFNGFTADDERYLDAMDERNGR